MVLVKKQDYTKEWLYERVSPLQVYEWYVPGIKIGKSVVKNPYRKDTHIGNFGICEKNGDIIWKDFADDQGGDCIKLVALIYSISYRQAIEKIAADMGIVNAHVQYDRKQIEEITTSYRSNTLIQITARKGYTKSDIQYWQQFLISEEQLIVEKVHSVTELYINRQKVPLNAKERIYAYEYPDNRFKIYMVDRPKGEKWKSNIPQSWVENLENLNGDKRVLIIHKSKKDRLCVSSLLPQYNHINTQNEGISSFNENLITKLREYNVYISFDCDPPGKKASMKITQQFGYKHINVPDIYWTENNIKDWSDMCKNCGPEPIVDHFIKKLEKTE